MKVIIEDSVLSQLRDDEKLSGTDEERVIQVLRAYLKAKASEGLISAGGQAPRMADIPRR